MSKCSGVPRESVDAAKLKLLVYQPSPPVVFSSFRELFSLERANDTISVSLRCFRLYSFSHHLKFTFFLNRKKMEAKILSPTSSASRLQRSSLPYGVNIFGTRNRTYSRDFCDWSTRHFECSSTTPGLLTSTFPATFS